MSSSPAPATSAGVKIALFFLFVLVLLSLGLNGFLIWQLATVRTQAVTSVKALQPQINETFGQVDAELEDLKNASLQFNIDVDRQIPINTEIPFDEVIEIPVQVTVPISENFATTIQVDPFGSGFTVPMDIEVPIDMEFPIDQTVSVPINKTVAISTTVPLSMTVPIDIAIRDTDLPPYIDRFRETLDSLATNLNAAFSLLE
jgi:hypothetical protein